MDEMLRTCNLCGGYADHKVFDNLSFTIEGPQLVTLLGPNGSGKSTLLKFFYKELNCKGGMVFVQGRDIMSLSQKEVARHIALVPQNGRIDYDFTVAESVSMGRYASTRNSSLGEVLSLCNLEMEADKSVLSLSGGELQRVMIARALIQKTSILLLDEPVSNLDIEHQIAMMRLFKHLAREENTTVVCVLHDLLLAQVYSDTVMLLSEGGVVSMGKTEKVITKDNLENVYHTKTQSLFDPALQRTVLTPLW
ncbi:MAG: ABC transporter ATP-binding protein [Sphaerochaetaceae bacterium]